MKSRRALLYVPGDDPRKLQKAAGSGADCVCLDIEDGVAVNRKDAAVTEIVQALRNLDFGRSERLVRVNPYSTGRTNTELDAVLAAGPDGIVLPKVNSAADIRRLDARLAEAELALKRPDESLALVALIESARAFLNLKEICEASPRLQALIFGAEDYAHNIGAIRTPLGQELFTARSLLVMHAAAYGLQAIDWVTVDFRDLDGVAQAARAGAELGFQGKQVIHPAQVEPVQQAFTPRPEEIERSRALIAAFEEHQRQGAGAFGLEGQMVDMPVIRQAQNLLERARAAGLI